MTAAEAGEVPPDVRDEEEDAPEGPEPAEPNDEADEPDTDGSDTDEPDADEPDFAAIVRPEVRVTWPVGVVGPLSRLTAAELAGPLAALDQLADALGTVFPEAGPGSLRADGVRWSAEHGWQLLLTPPYDTTGAHQVAGDAFDEPDLVPAWRRDQQAVAVALVEAAFGRRPADPAEARRLADLTAGELPQGFDAAVNLLLREQVRPGDTTPLRTLSEALRRRSGARLRARYFLESGVGSAKALGRGSLDNEDVAVGFTGPDGSLRLGLFDGATGDGDGQGRAAAMTAHDRIVRAWTSPGAIPEALLGAADEAVCAATDGSSTAIVVTVDPAGRGRLASLGDSSAWLVRRGVRGAFHAWRLTPAHTAYAAAVRAAAGPAAGYSELTHYLGGGADDVFSAGFSVCPGDLLVLVSDGAAVEQRHEWFGDVLGSLAAESAGQERPLGAVLAAELVGRAERGGGFDNATALIADFVPI